MAIRNPPTIKNNPSMAIYMGKANEIVTNVSGRT